MPYFLADETTPWLGAGIGLIVGVCIMISDYIFTSNPTVSNLLIPNYSRTLITRNRICQKKKTQFISEYY